LQVQVWYGSAGKMKITKQTKPYGCMVNVIPGFDLITGYWDDFIVPNH